MTAVQVVLHHPLIVSDQEPLCEEDWGICLRRAGPLGLCLNYPNFRTTGHPQTGDMRVTLRVPLYIHTPTGTSFTLEEARLMFRMFAEAMLRQWWYA